MESNRRMNGVCHRKCLHALDLRAIHNPHDASDEHFNIQFFVSWALTFSYQLLSRNVCAMWAGVCWCGCVCVSESTGRAWTNICYVIVMWIWSYLLFVDQRCRRWRLSHRTVQQTNSNSIDLTAWTRCNWKRGANKFVTRKPIIDKSIHMHSGSRNENRK